MIDYKYSQDFTVTDEIKRRYDEDGYLIVRQLFEPETIEKVKNIIENAEAMTKYRHDLPDKEGNKGAIVAWNRPGSDVTGLMTRCEKVIDIVEKCLGGEVYHYFSKLTMKWAKTGAGFYWHQDYGYWYDFGNLFPDMGTLFVAIDECTKENGCLQLIRGSHKCGRLPHTKLDGADITRVEEIKKKLPLDILEMKPGDAVFFHCNTLHMSEPNKSDERRICFPIAYNRASNNPTKKHHHSSYFPLKKVSNEDLLQCTNTTDMTGKDFIFDKTHKAQTPTDEKE